MTKASDFYLCQQYLNTYMENIQEQLNQYQIELTKQYQSCPIVNLSLDNIDRSLKKLAYNQRQYLVTRNNKRLLKFKNEIYKENLLTTFSLYQLSDDQVSGIFYFL